MDYKATAIVLKRIPYSDSKLIMHIFTREYGRLAVIMHAGKGQKSKYKRNLASPMQLLDLVLYKRPGADIFGLKEVKHNYVFKRINNDIKRSSVAMYLMEFFNKVIKTSEPNQAYFDFCRKSILCLDNNAKIENLHLFVLVKSLIYMGIKPRVLDKNKPYFDISSGESSLSLGINSMNMDNTNILRCILGKNLDSMIELKLNSKQRIAFLDKIEQYWICHFEGFTKSKSLKVLRQLWD